MTDASIHPASYKDPAGFIFQYNNHVYRQVNRQYAGDYKLLQESGLYDALTAKSWLIPHTEINENITGSAEWHKTLLPEQLSFISYPYEWSFDMLKDAALLTLKINKKAIGHGMILKDATPFNIQFHQGKPLFIDSLSFEKYDETKPWIAYRQFCECFLFPLYLTHYTTLDAARLLSIYPDGLSARTTASLLPLKAFFNLHVWMHVYLQKNIQHKGEQHKKTASSFNRKKLLLLNDGLITAVKHLTLRGKTTWDNYYTDTIPGKQYLQNKEKIFRKYLNAIPFDRALDLGANEGYFSKILAEKARFVIATDYDEKCINNLYKSINGSQSTNITPLIIDISHSSSSAGFRDKERRSFIERGQADLLTALALVHHLVLRKNIPLQQVAGFFASLCNKYLIVEFVPLNDVKAQELVKNKNDYHKPYNETAFEHSFSKFFMIENKEEIPGTARILYRMKKL